MTDEKDSAYPPGNRHRRRLPAADRGQIDDVDPDVTAWALMGMGELIGLRWLLWDSTGTTSLRMPEQVFDHTITLVERALRPPTAKEQA